MIIFNKKDPDYACFSNFYPCSIEYGGITYSNSEAAWQSLKTMDIDERRSFSECTGSSAKKKGRKVKLREDWEDMKYDLMVEICFAKFAQNEDIRGILFSTGDEEIVENTTAWHDNIWGNCYCPRCINKPGKNLMGKALMTVRERLKEEMK